MFAVIKIIFVLATSKQGSSALRRLAAYLDSEYGRRLVAQTRKVMAGPEAQRIARQVRQLLRDAAATTPVVRANWPGKLAAGAS